MVAATNVIAKVMGRIACLGLVAGELSIMCGVVKLSFNKIGLVTEGAD